MEPDCRYLHCISHQPIVHNGQGRYLLLMVIKIVIKSQLYIVVNLAPKHLRTPDLQFCESVQYPCATT